MIMRSIVVVLIFAIIGLTPAYPDDAPFQDSNILSALVRIETRFFDFDGNQVGDTEYGHGVSIGTEGVVATAAHVVFPSIQSMQKLGAANYSLRIRPINDFANPISFETDPRKFVDIPASEVPNRIKIANPASLVSCPETETIICAGSEFPLTEDFALIRHEDLITPAFLNIAPKKSKFWSYKSNSHIGVISDFSRREIPRGVEIHHNVVSEHAQFVPAPDSFYSNENVQFGPGISGSPVIAIPKYDEMKIPSVIGFVSRARKNENSPDKTFFDTTMVQNASINSELSPEPFLLGLITPSEKPWKCNKEPTWPIVADYAAYEKGVFDEEGKKRVRTCMTKISTWKDFSVYLDAISDPEAINKVKNLKNNIDKSLADVIAATSTALTETSVPSDLDTNVPIFESTIQNLASLTAIAESKGLSLSEYADVLQEAEKNENYARYFRSVAALSANKYTFANSNELLWARVNQDYPELRLLSPTEAQRVFEPGFLYFGFQSDINGPLLFTMPSELSLTQEADIGRNILNALRAEELKLILESDDPEIEARIGREAIKAVQKPLEKVF